MFPLPRFPQEPLYTVNWVFSRLKPVAMECDRGEPRRFSRPSIHLGANLVAKKLREQAEKRGGIERMLRIHARTAPKFVNLVRGQIT